LQDVTDMRWESVDLQNKWIAFRAGKTRQCNSLRFPSELPAPIVKGVSLTLTGKERVGNPVFRWRSTHHGRACVRGEVVYGARGELRGRTVNTLYFTASATRTRASWQRRSVGRSPTEAYRSCIGGNERHYTHHEIETLRSAIGKLPTVRPQPPPSGTIQRRLLDLRCDYVHMNRCAQSPANAPTALPCSCPQDRHGVVKARRVAPWRIVPPVTEIFHFRL
jgi:hypothetical protein